MPQLPSGPASRSQQSSAQRPVPLKARTDLVFERIVYGDSAWHVVKDPCSLSYYRLQPEQYSVWQLLDGERSLEEVRDALQAAHPTALVSLLDVQVLVTDLHEKGLLVTDRLGQGEPLLRRGREKFWKQARQTLSNPLFIRLPGWDPDPLLTRMLPLVRWMFSWWALACAMLFVCFSWIFLAMHFDDVRARLPEFQQFFTWPNLFYLWLTMAAAKVLHEFGHGLACKYFGRECHAMGVMMLVFSPTLYCDVTDAWMINAKWPRIVIAGAGMAVEIVLAAAAIFLWWNTESGLLNHLCLNLFFVSTVTTVIFNANPLLRFDGYYMLSDWLEIPNLRQKATRLLQQTFAWHCLGIELRSDAFMPQHGRGWLVFYAIASTVYRWIVLFGITLFLYTVLKPYQLQSLGIALAVVSLGATLFGLVRSVVQILKTPRSEPMSRKKLAVTLTVSMALLAGVLLIPVPWHIQAPFYLEPEDVRPVYTNVAGFLADGRPAGATVAAGDVIAVLDNPELDERVRQLANAEHVQFTLTRALEGDPDRQRLSQQHLLSIREQRADAEQQQAQLRIKAVAAGTLVEPPRIPEPTLAESREQLSLWAGVPLLARNLGAFLEKPTHLCSIAPTENFQAVLLVDQQDRNDLAVGQVVRLKIEHLPDAVFDGTITEFSQEQEEFAPAALSNKYGGPLPTVTDPLGREQLTGVVYKATVQFEIEPELLRTGMRGEARVLVDRRTVGGWVWRWIRATIRFRL